MGGAPSSPATAVQQAEEGAAAAPEAWPEDAEGSASENSTNRRAGGRGRRRPRIATLGGAAALKANIAEQQEARMAELHQLAAALTDSVESENVARCSVLGHDLLMHLRELDEHAIAADAHSHHHHFGPHHHAKADGYQPSGGAGQSARVQLYGNLLGLTPRREARGVLTAVSALRSKQSHSQDDEAYWGALSKMFATSLARDDAVPSDHSLAEVFGWNAIDASTFMQGPDERIWGAARLAERKSGKLSSTCTCRRESDSGSTISFRSTEGGCQVQ